MDPKIKNILITSLLFLLIVLLNVLVILKEILKPFYRFIFARKQPLFLRTPEDRFKGDLFLLCQKKFEFTNWKDKYVVQLVKRSHVQF